MKSYIKYTFTIFIIFLLGCENKGYHTLTINNSVYKPNTVFRSFEDRKSQKFEHLKDKYQLDTVVDHQLDELTQILKFRQWINRVIEIDVTPGRKYSGGGYAEGILDAALTGEGFHCGHFMIVQNAILNGYGYVTRCIGAGPGIPGIVDNHHGINEVWLNSYNKWFLCDAKYNHHFEKNGTPLSALEIRDEYLKNEPADIVMVKGLNRIPTKFDDVLERSKESFARTYTWVEWDAHTNRFTVWPDFETLLVMYEDTYFKNHKWLWDGKPHWAYDTDFLIPEPNRDAIEWTPNTIASNIIIENKQAIIELISDTPNLLEYQMKKLPNGNWEKVGYKVLLELNETQYEIVFRAVNMAEISGPKHRVIISSR
ncbi:MAG: hypothetical protein KAR17_15835 [Cyclobacteriaceae bacterium]|nr:hypothetical protein [Cyclobacteriaceae bacterium]